MVASGKGGTGKSMFTVNVGLSLARAGYRTLLLDMDIGMRSLDLYLGMQDMAIYDLADIVRGSCTSESATIISAHSDKLHMIPAPQFRTEGLIDNDSFGEFLKRIEAAYEIIIVDCPPGMNETINLCASFADLLTLVITSDYLSIRDADALEDHLIRMGLMNRTYVVNRMMPELVKDEIEAEIAGIGERLKCDMLGLIAEDSAVRVSTGLGIPLVAVSGDNYIADNFKKMSERMIKKLGL